MKKKTILAILTISFLVVTLISCATNPQEPGKNVITEIKYEEQTEPVVFTDPVLEMVVRNKLSQPKGALKRSDLAKITELSHNGELNIAINELNGCEHLSGLTSLKLPNNKIKDLTPLKGLTSLIELELNNNQIADVRYLVNLVELESLNLSDNMIVDIKALFNLKSLKSLTLNNLHKYKATTVVSLLDLTPLSSLTALTSLSLDNNSISSDVIKLEPLTGLHSLTSLSLKGNYNTGNSNPDKSLLNLVPLKEMTSLREINLENNSEQGNLDLTPLVENQGFGQGCVLHIRAGNNLTHLKIRELEDKGVTIK